MMRSTHYHVTHQGRRSRPVRYQALAQQAALRYAGMTGTPSGFLPGVVACYDAACLDPPPASVTTGTRIPIGSQSRL
jgi:hypothetical protein